MRAGASAASAASAAGDMLVDLVITRQLPYAFGDVLKLLRA